MSGGPGDERLRQLPEPQGPGGLRHGRRAGIGAGIVEHFCAQGSRVAFVDLLVEESEALAEETAKTGAPEPVFIHCGLRDIEAPRATIKRTGAELGPIRVLVNDAANDTRHKVEDVTVEYWDDRINVNLRHPFFAAQAARAQMKAAGAGSRRRDRP